MIVAREVDLIAIPRKWGWNPGLHLPGTLHKDDILWIAQQTVCVPLGGESVPLLVVVPYI